MCHLGSKKFWVDLLRSAQNTCLTAKTSQIISNPSAYPLTSGPFWKVHIRNSLNSFSPVYMNKKMLFPLFCLAFFFSDLWPNSKRPLGPSDWFKVSNSTMLNCDKNEIFIVCELAIFWQFFRHLLALLNKLYFEKCNTWKA